MTLSLIGCAGRQCVPTQLKHSSRGVNEKPTHTEYLVMASVSVNVNVSNPPKLDESVDYENWKKQVAMWQVCCKYEKIQQGSALALSLQGNAREAVLELSMDDLCKDTGVQLILTTLDGLFLKDVNQRMYVSMKTFEQHKRSKGQSLDDFINEFERKLNKIKAHKIVFPDEFHAYRLLESANLEQSKNELIRTTIGTLTYKEMKAQLRKLEDVIVDPNSSESPANVKTEPDDVYYSRYGNGNRGRGSGRSRGGFRGGFRGGRGGRGGFQNSFVRHCYSCGSPEHIVRDCPNRNEQQQQQQQQSNQQQQQRERRGVRFHDEEPQQHEEIRLTL